MRPGKPPGALGNPSQQVIGNVPLEPPGTTWGLSFAWLDNGMSLWYHETRKGDGEGGA